MYILAYIQRVYCTVRVRFLFQRFIVYSVYNSVLHTYSVIHFSNNYAPAPVGKGAINVAFVRSSVAYTANSRTQRLSVPKFGRKVLHLRYDWHTSFNVKWSKVKVTRPINADTHRALYSSNGKTYELQIRYMD